MGDERLYYYLLASTGNLKLIPEEKITIGMCTEAANQMEWLWNMCHQK